MKRFLLLLTILLIPQAQAYVSPENYAVNEADLTDYRMIAPSPKLNVDSLDDERFQAPNIVEADIQINENDKNTKKSDKKNSQINPREKKLSYKVAKWWVDQRYKREEPHHGELHEIKVNKRIEYEKKEQEALAAKAQSKAQVTDFQDETGSEHLNAATPQYEPETQMQEYAPNPALFY